MDSTSSGKLSSCRQFWLPRLTEQSDIFHFDNSRSGNFIMEEELAGCHDIHLYIHEVDQDLDITVGDLQIDRQC